MMSSNNRKKGSRILAMLLAASMVISLGADVATSSNVYAAESKEYTCGLEEHTHSVENGCYETQTVEKKVLTCGQEETEADEGHTHTEDCYTTTTEDVLTCENTDEDHVHSDECYETKESKELTCGQEETAPTEGHTHTDDCYTTETVEKDVLTCEQQEHTHSDECLATDNKENKTVQNTENETTETTVVKNADYDQTYIDAAEDAVDEDATAVDNLVAVADSQDGYTQQIADDTENDAYTLYGNWYSDGENSGMAWDAAFVAWCMEQAGFDSERELDVTSLALPVRTNLSAWIRALQAKEDATLDAEDNGDVYDSENEDSETIVALSLYVDSANGDGVALTAGDIAFLDLDQDGDADHVGIVASTDETEDEVTREIAIYIPNIDGEALSNYVDDADTDATPAVVSIAIPGDNFDWDQDDADAAAQDVLAQTVVGYIPMTLYQQQVENVGLDDGDDEDDDRVTTDGNSACVILSETPVEASPSLVSINDGVVEIEDATSEHDFGNDITKGTFEKIVNGVWTSQDPSTAFWDGNSVRVTLDFKIPANTVNLNQRSITYQLPSGVVITGNEGFSGQVMKSDGSKSYAVGDYTITADGLITITYYEQYANNQEIEGYVMFEATLDRSKAGDSGKIEFGGKGGTLIVQELPATYDLSLSKTGTYDQETKKLSYVVKATTNKGTSEGVTITDFFTQYGENNKTLATYDQDSFKVYKINSQGEKVGNALTAGSDYTLTFGEDNHSYKITGLAQLEAGYGYQVEYTGNPGTIAENTDGKQVIANYAQATSGNYAPGANSNITISNARLDKSGSYDSTNDKIKWTITVNNSNDNLNNYTVTDNVKEALNGLKITGDVTVETTPKSGATTTATYKVGSTDATDWGITADGITHTFSGTDKTVITFYTTAPEQAEGATTLVTNKVTGDTDSKESTVPVTKRDWDVQKNSNGQSNDGTAANWYVNIKVPASENGETITYKDRITDAVDGNGKSYENTHWITWTQLDAIYKSITLADGYTKGEKAQEFSYTVKAYSDSEYTQEITRVDNPDAQIKYWTLTVNVPEWARGYVANIALNYQTTIDYSAQDEETKWTFKNTGIVGTKEHDAEYTHEQPKSIQKFSALSLDQTGNWAFAMENRDGFSGEDRTLTLSKDSDGTYWYRVLIQTKKTTTSDITITDTLPQGVHIEGISDYILSNGRIKTKDTVLNYDDGSPIFVYMKQNPGTGQVYNYEIQRATTVEYTDNKSTDGRDVLTVKIAYKDPDAYDENNPNNEFTYQNPNGGTNSWNAPYFEILYKVTIDENSEAWKDLGSKNQGSYTNDVKWGTKEASITDTVEEAKERVKKTSEIDAGNNARVKYTVEINPGAEDLNSEDNFITLTDQLGSMDWSQTYKLPTGITSATLILSSVKLYSYNKEADKTTGSHIGTELSSDLYTVVLNETGYNFTVTLPDKLACVLQYEYEFVNGSDKAVSVPNTVTLSNGDSSSKTTEIADRSSSAGSRWSDVAIYKVDATDYTKRLEGVKFTLKQYNKAGDNGSQTAGWTYVDGESGGNTGAEKGDDNIWYYVTNEQGKVVLTTNASDSTGTKAAKLNKGVLYRLEEVDRGSNTGYSITWEPYYFIIADSQSEAEAALSNLGISDYGSLTDTIRTSETDTTTKQVYKKDVKIFLTNFAGTEASIYFENKFTSIAVKKVWQDKDGNDISDADKLAKMPEITVELWRHTSTPDGYDVNLTLDYYYEDWQSTKQHTTYAVPVKSIKKGSQVKLLLATSWNTTKENAEASFKFEDLPSGWTVDAVSMNDAGTAWQVQLISPAITEDVVTDGAVSYTLTRLSSEWGNTESTDKSNIGTWYVDYEKPDDADIPDAVYKTITLNKDNWSYQWDDLPLTDGETKYTYYIKEQSVPGYSTSYSTNNSGLTEGHVYIYNREEDIYYLPETGGTGTLPWRFGGTFAVVLSLLSGAYMIRRRKYTLGN